MPIDGHLEIGGFLFPRMDQLDFTGPFEILSRIPDSTFHIAAKTMEPVRDARDLVLTPETTFGRCPPLDVLLIPGGSGQYELMEDPVTLDFIRRQAANAKIVFSVCTGSLTFGATGLLRGVRCTTHWASFDVLQYLGAIPVKERVVIDGRFVSAAGVSSGLDGALIVASMLRGERVAQEIQLYIQYAPEPPFPSGSPDTAPPEVLLPLQNGSHALLEKRIARAQRIAARWKP